MLKNFFKKGEDENSKKRQIENIVVFIVILIVTVLIINNMWSSEEQNKKEENNSSSKVLAESNDISTQENLEKNLEDILESINGVGKVKVLITYSETSEIVAMYNETNSESNTEETDGNGGNKSTKETENKREIVYTDENGKSEPITEKIIMPKIEGAIVTAEGAENANVKTSIVNAVEAVTGLAVHKIQVFEMGKK